MVTAKDLPAIENAAPTDISIPPGDLYSDEPTLETDFHLRQIILLLNSLEWLWQDRTDFFASGNLTIYFSPQQIKSQDFRGPDFFVVLDTERRTRKSWVVWEEDGKYPNVIIEVLSDTTARSDRGLKKQVYQNTFRTPEYFWFDPHTLEFAGFVLMAGEYEPITPTPEGRLWSRQLHLFLGLHDDTLRFFTPEGELVPLPEEAARSAQQEIQQAQQVAQPAQEWADRLAERLRSLGVDPEALD
jgi:Uma2 family endonuclease